MASEWLKFSQGRAVADYIKFVPLGETRRQQRERNMTTILQVNNGSDEILVGEWSMSITIIDTAK